LIGLEIVTGDILCTQRGMSSYQRRKHTRDIVYR
jgi:hypothetical protein